MDERDFDKKLAEKLKNISDFAYDESNWNALNSKLDGKNRDRYSTLYLAAALLLLTLLGTNGWMGYQWHNTEQKLQEVNHILDTLHYKEKAATTKIYFTDTIYKKVIVHQYDTIYHKVVYQQNEEVNAHSGIRRGLFKLDDNTEEIVMNKEIHTVKAETGQNLLNQSITNENLLEDSMLPSAKPADSLQKSKKENIPDSLPIEQPEAEKQEVIISPKKGREKDFHSHSFYAGLSTQVPFVSHPATFNRGGLGGGLRGMYSFNEHIRATLQVNYLNVRYNVNNFEESLGIIDINNGSSYQNDELVSVASKQQYIQGALGISYIFGNKQKLRPFISLSYLAETSLSRHLDYQYRDINTEKIYLREAEDKGGNTTWHILEAALGVEYKLRYRSLLHLEGYYNKKTGQEFLVRPDQFGARAVFYFQIK